MESTRARILSTTFTSTTFTTPVHGFRHQVPPSGRGTTNPADTTPRQFQFRPCLCFSPADSERSTVKKSILPGTSSLNHVSIGRSRLRPTVPLASTMPSLNRQVGTQTSESAPQRTGRWALFPLVSEPMAQGREGSYSIGSLGKCAASPALRPVGAGRCAVLSNLVDTFRDEQLEHDDLDHRRYR